METPFMWIPHHHAEPAGKFPIVLTGAIVALLVVAWALAALVPRTGPAASQTQADRSHVQFVDARLQFGHSPIAGDLTPG